MIPKQIEEITEADVQSLIDSKVIEHKTLEYKEALPGNSDADKKKFLAEVSSFANTSGGDIVYGVAEDEGVPTEVKGLDLTDADGAILRLDNMTRDGIRPRIPGMHIRAISLADSKVAIVARTPSSWVSPHRVVFGGHNGFYARSSNGKYEMDVGELRIAFNLSESIAEKIRQFVLERTSLITSGAGPVRLHEGAKIALHVVPVASFGHAQSIDIDQVASNRTSMPPIHTTGWNDRYNLDGILTFTPAEDGQSWAYTQLFRNGILEAVNGSLLRADGEKKYVWPASYEGELIASLTGYLSLLKSLGTQPPIIVFLTLLGVNGYSMPPHSGFATDGFAIDRANLRLPERVISGDEDDAKSVLRPLFDSIWNACGYPRSLNFDENGEWNPRR